MMKPFMRWAGGKQNLINKMIPYLPDEKKINRYFEPFLGAGSMFFATNFKINYLSDINYNLINCYISIKNKPVYMILLLNKMKKNIIRDKNYYYEVREEFNKRIDSNSFAQSARFLFLIYTSYNGIYRVNKAGKYNVPFGNKIPNFPDKERLLKVQSKLQKCNVEVRNYYSILSMLEKGDFIYLDPPYPPINGTSYFQHYTKDKFSYTKQEEVAEFANNAKEESFIMISNADTPQIRDLYTGWNIVKLNTIRTISCKKQRHKIDELLIMNYSK